MESTKKCKKTGFATILWATTAIFLCSGSCVWALTIEVGEEYKIPDDYIPGATETITVKGTLNIVPGAQINLLYATNTSTVKITGGTVVLWIDVAVGAEVTVYGTGFNLGEGTHFIDYGTVTGSYENGNPITLTFDCVAGATVTLAAPGSQPPENQPPVPEAGPDLTVFTKDIASTVINGTATDPDEGDTLQYRWVEGTIAFISWAPVGTSGEAPLDLGTILPQYLGVGTHTLTLEVSDGKETVSDDMVLTIVRMIDIKPGSYPNSINLGSNGVVPVAILSSNTFDATTVEPTTVELAGSGVAVRGKGKSLAHEEDVNGDGLIDLVVQVETENLDPDTFQDGYAILKGLTFDGVEFQGSDEITIVPSE